MSLAGMLDQQLRAAGVPIVGVRLGQQGDKATWTIQFDNATPAQQATAAGIVAGLATDAATVTDSDVQDRLDDKALKAVVIWVAQKLTIPPATARAQIVAIYKALP